MKKILCLDFDGVLCDSAVECLVTGYNAYHDAAVSGPDEIEPGLRDYFLKYRYLVGPANDFGVLFHAFEQGGETLTRESYDAMREATRAMREDFGPRFFASRDRLKQDMDHWLGLHRLFEQSRAVLDIGFPSFYVITTKDADSVMRLAEFSGYHGRILGVYGKEIATDKRVSFQTLFRDRNDQQASETYLFVDDNVVHLQQVSDLPVEPWLATWGYVDPEAAERFRHLKDLADLKGLVE